MYSQEDMTKEQINELHHLLVNTVVDYINKNNVEDLQEVRFNADELQASARYGKWCPETDSYLGCIGYKWSEDRLHLPERYNIGESY